MSQLLSIEPAEGIQTDLGVVLCGSYRRDPRGLAMAFDELVRRFRLLSPRSLDFVDPLAQFVLLENELQETPAQVESRHLAAMRRADFIWLHAPEGYVGVSASLEIGQASALGIPVFTDSLLTDPVLSSLVHFVEGPTSVTRDLVQSFEHPGSGLSRLQRHYELAAKRRGWSDESSEETLFHLRDEVGELITAMEKRTRGIRKEDDRDADVPGELADVQLYLVHLANVLGLELADAVTEKESSNTARFERALTLD